MMSTKASSENLSKSCSKQDAEKNSYIQVFLRVRPFNQQELNKHALQVVDTPGSTSAVVRDPKVGLPKTFTFDRVFGPNSRQIDVYKTVVAPLIAEVLLGYNCTVFAYGQTGTGKTFTMEGERTIKDSVDSDPLAGILPRALSQLFDEVRMMNCEFTMRVSFLELYNEELFDLLAPIEDNKPKTLRLFEDSNRKGSVIIQGLEEVIVQNKHEVYAVLDRGSQQRKTAATLMNATSSRSHTVFTITVHMKESSVEGEEMLKVGKLNLVDLAGSENIGKSGAVDKRAREAGSINQSLLTLGRVITALTEKTPHVPYRESKLTRLLQDSLGGKTKTSIIATVGPASSNLEETLSTLDYACRAKCIQNKPEVNQRLTKKEALNIYTEEIERLRRDLNATREKNGIYVDMENYNRTVSQIESLNRELNEKSNKIKDLEETIVNKDEEIRESSEKIKDMREELQTKQSVIDETLARKKAVEKSLMKAGERVDELSHLVKYHEETEERMGDEAQMLLDTTTDTVSIVENLHMKLDRIRTIEERNWKNSKRFRQDYHEGMDEVLTTVKRLKDDHAIHTSKMQSKLRAHCRSRKIEAEKFTSTFPLACANLKKIGETILGFASKFESSASQKLAAAGNFSEAQWIKHEELGAEFADIAEEKTQELKKAIAEMQKEAQNLQNIVNSLFAEMNDCVLEALKDSAERYEAIDGIVKTMTGFFNSFMDQAQSKLNAFETNNATFQQGHLKNLELMEQTIQSMKTEMEGMHKQSNEVCAGLGQELASMNTKLDEAASQGSDKLRNGKTVVENAEKKFADIKGELNTTTVNALGNMVEKLSLCSNDAQDSVDTMNKYKSETETNYNMMIDNYKKCNEQIARDLKNTKKDMKVVLDDHSRDIAYAEEKTLETVTTLGEIEDELVDEVIEALNAECDQINARGSKVTSGCCQLAGSVEEFWDQTYLTDSPTGATPCRKRFDYPQELSKPSPQASVLERYRRFKRDMQTAMGHLADSGSDDDAASIKSSGTVVDERQDDFADMEADNVVVEEDNNENQDPEVFYPPNARLLETINESPEGSVLSVNESKNVAPPKPEPSSSSSSKSSRSDSGSDGSDGGKSPKKKPKNVEGKAKDNNLKKMRENFVEKNKRGGKGVLKTPNK